MGELSDITRLVQDLRGLARTAGVPTTAAYAARVVRHARRVARTRSLLEIDAAMDSRWRTYRLDAGVSVRLPPGSLSSAREMYCRRVYQRRPGFEMRPGLILDLGANRGLFSLWAAKAGGRAIAVEAQVEFVDQMRQTLAANGCADRVNIRHAIIGADGLLDLGSGIAPILTVDDLTEEPFDLVKMDVEGSEFSIIREGGTWLDRTARIVIEVHTEFGNEAEIVDALARRDYVVTVTDEAGRPARHITGSSGYVFAHRRDGDAFEPVPTEARLRSSSRPRRVAQSGRGGMFIWQGIGCGRVSPLPRAVGGMRTVPLEERSSRYGVVWREAFDAAIEPFLTENMTILDVGAGRAPAIRVADRPPGCRYVGLDPSAEELRLADADAYDDVVVADITKREPSLAKTVDLVVSLQVLEHVRPLDQAFGNIHSYLRPGGAMVAQLSGKFSAFAIVNQLVPRRIGLRLLDGLLGRERTTVFPAYYDRCYATALARILAGWSSVRIVPRFRGAGYFAFSPTLERAYLGYEDWAMRSCRNNLATHYLVVAQR